MNYCIKLPWKLMSVYHVWLSLVLDSIIKSSISINSNFGFPLWHIIYIDEHLIKTTLFNSIKYTFWLKLLINIYLKSCIGLLSTSYINLKVSGDSFGSNQEQKIYCNVQILVRIKYLSQCIVNTFNLRVKLRTVYYHL